VVFDAGADVADGPGAEVADDVWHRGELAHRAGKQVPALDADRLGVDDHEAAGAFGVGHVFVAEHLRVAVLVDDRGLHVHRSPSLVSEVVIRCAVRSGASHGGV
jgi:hypothetical protein